MNWTKFFIAVIATFVFIFFFGFLWYGKLMHEAHNEVSVLWRSGPDFPWLIFGHIVMAFFLTAIYARSAAAGGPGTGATLGILIALLCTGKNLITFAVQPLTMKILGGWVVGDLIMFAIAGAIVGAIYTPRAMA
jgi:hypothetical protein